jgi:cytochrome c peroxidase
MSKNLGRWLIVVTVTTLLVALLIAGPGLAQPTPIEQLGEFLYFDENLSEPAGQSCASCHEPTFGFVDPDKGLPVSEGVIPGLFGTRNSPMSAYAMYAPTFHFDDGEGLWIGGQFWDGRATGDVLGDPLADQALGPFLNPVEMNNPSKAAVIADVAASDYAGLFEQVWGPGSLADVEGAYDQVALSIAAFERTALFGQFSSKYDAYLQACLAGGGTPGDCSNGIGDAAATAGAATFSKKEWKGLQLFMDPDNDNDGTLDPDEGAACVLCHVADWIEDPGNVVVPDWAPYDATAEKYLIPPVFTDFTFDNLGVPRSDHKLLRDAEVDLGLGPIVKDTEENGKFKVMTLRNIQLTKPYAHNGFFKSLKDITHFYNTRDVPEEAWPVPEVPETINVEELGNLGLSEADEKALVEFMKTLTDK